MIDGDFSQSSTELRAKVPTSCMIGPDSPRRLSPVGATGCNMAAILNLTNGRGRWDYILKDCGENVQMCESH